MQKTGYNEEMWKRISIALAAILALVITATIATRAWLSNQTELRTYTAVTNPTTLSIMGGKKSAIQQLDLSKIDLRNEQEAYFVFCVVGSRRISYRIELAHTTNIPFAYTLYPATTTDPGSDTPCAEYQYQENGIDKIEKYYIRNSKLSGSYVNQDSTNSDLAAASGSAHDITYNGMAEGVTIQKNAEPLYWLSDLIAPTTQEDTDGEYVDYYVLKLSWDDTLNTNQDYAKETDLVYVMAEN